MPFHVFRLHWYPVGQVTRQARRVWATQQRFPAYRLQTVGANNNVSPEFRLPLYKHCWLFEIHSCYGASQFYTYTQLFSLFDHNLVEVGAVDVQVCV